MEQSLEREIPMDWQHVASLRQVVHDALGYVSDDVRSAAVMVTSELVENAVKYGEATRSAPSAHFRLDTDNGQIRIQVSNGARSEAAVAKAIRLIERIHQATDKDAFYVERQRELLESPACGGGLGLYRIIHEGKFSLSCSYSGQVFTVTAIRENP
jgi:hypothetical protein